MSPTSCQTAPPRIRQTRILGAIVAQFNNNMDDMPTKPQEIPGAMQLLAVEREAGAEERALDLPLEAREALDATRLMYAAEGAYQPPWISYLAIVDDEACGICSFKSPPTKEGVEIAYYTFPHFERRGLGGAMARELVRIARAAAPAVPIMAETLAKESASTKILIRLGFERIGEIEDPQDGALWVWKLSS